MHVLKNILGLTEEEYSASKEKIENPRTTETPKRSLSQDDQNLNSNEFIAWNEDAVPSSSTQPPRKIIKQEPVAMETQAGDFDNPSNVDDENDHNKETGGDEGICVSILFFIE